MSSNNPYADSGVVSDSDDDLPPLVDEDGDVYDDSPQLIGSSGAHKHVRFVILATINSIFPPQSW